MQKMCTKVRLKSLVNFGKWQPLNAKNSFKNKIFWKRIIKNPEKINFIFYFEPSSFNEQDYERQKGLETSGQLLIRLQNKFRKNPLLLMHYVTKSDDVIQSGFWVILKITSANLSKLIHGIINYSTFICPFESRKCRKEGKNTQKFEYFEKEKRF